MIQYILAALAALIGVVTLFCIVLLIVYAIPPSKPVLSTKEKEDRAAGTKWSGIGFGGGVGALLLLWLISYLAYDTKPKDTNNKINT